MAIRRRGPRGGLVSTRLPVPTINSVGRNAANKRAPHEAENLDNCFVSLERNIEKRPGFEVVPQDTIPDRINWDFTDPDTRVDLYRLAGIGLPEDEDPTITTKDFWYYWHSINEDNRYLIVIDFKARTNAKNLYYVFQILSNGTWKDVTPVGQDVENSTVPTETRAYLTFGSDVSDLGVVKSAAESLQGVSIGTNVIILNKNVSAGFSSDADGLLFNLKGEKTATVDIAGRPVTYYSAAKVVPVLAAGNDNIAFTSDDISLGYRPMTAVQNDVLQSMTTVTTDPLVVDVVLGDKAVSQTAAYVGYQLQIIEGSHAGSYGTINEYFGSTKTARVGWVGPIPQTSGLIAAAPYQVDNNSLTAIPTNFTAYNIAFVRANSNSVLPQNGILNGGYFQVQKNNQWVNTGTVSDYTTSSGTTIEGTFQIRGYSEHTITLATGLQFRVAHSPRTTRSGNQYITTYSYFTGVISGNAQPVNPSNKYQPFALTPPTYAIPLANSAKQEITGSVTSTVRSVLTEEKKFTIGGRTQVLKTFNRVFTFVFTGDTKTLKQGDKLTISINNSSDRFVLNVTTIDSPTQFTSIWDSALNPTIPDPLIYNSAPCVAKKAGNNYYNDFKFEILYTGTPASGKVIKYDEALNTAYVSNWSGPAPLVSNTYNLMVSDTEYSIEYIDYTGVKTVNTTVKGTDGVDGVYPDVQLIYHSGATATSYPKANIIVTNNEVSSVQIVSNARGGRFNYNEWKNNPTVLKASTSGIPGVFRCTVTELYNEVPKQIPVEDYTYFQKSLGYLGQKLNDASEIKFPPNPDDWYDKNSNNNNPVDLSASEMLKILYDPKHPYGNYTSVDNKIVNANLAQGRGKVYYCSNPFLSLTSGYYRVISWAENAGNQFAQIPSLNNVPKILKQDINPDPTQWAEIKPAGRPYLQKVRTPDKWSVIDSRRMPQKLSLDGGVFTIGSIRWTPRESGNNDTNPGPSVFRNSNRDELKQTQIIGMCVFKDRLWFAADDVAFSSQIGKYEDLFIEDPANIVATDPIDIRASSNAFAQITHMVPFEDYIFINTKANTQFQLTAGSRDDNDIVLTPFNVMLSPATYYSAASFVDPQTIGSQLYFFDRRKLYLFTGKNNLGLNSAVEVSATANYYLPENYGVACVGHAQNTIFVTDADNKNHIYLYTIRFSGERVIQNSFYRYVLDNNAAVYSMQVYDKYLYAVIHKNDRVMIERTLLKDEHPSIPRMDHMFKIRISTSTAEGNEPNTTYNPGLHETTYKLPAANFSANDTLRVVIAAPAVQRGEDISGVAFPPLVSFSNEVSYITVTVLGRFDTEGAYVYIGIPYKMVVELSPLFIRDENGNIVDGTLNLRTIVVRHFNTGNYDIEVAHRGRAPLVSSFTAIRPDFTLNEDSLPLEAWTVNGEFVGKVFGYSESTNIKLTSEYITPVNISAIEFKGKFKQKYSTIN